MDELIDYQEYYLQKENIIVKKLIIKDKNEIFIKNNNYEISFNKNRLSLLMNRIFNSLNEAYIYLINLFDENKVTIENIIINKEIKLIINEEKEVKITLIKKIENKNLIMNEIKKLRNEVIKLKEENNELKKEIIQLKQYHLPKEKENNEVNIGDRLMNYNLNNNPISINTSIDIVKDSFADDDSDNSFCVFKSINNILYLIYSNSKKSIICYDMIDQKIITKIINYLKEFITNYRHYLDKINNRDLVMTISMKDRNIRILNANNWESILNITNIYISGFLYSGCFLNENNQIYIITSPPRNELIKVFDLNGNKIKEINNSKDRTFFIDTYYDDIKYKNYIIACNEKYLKSYDYNKNELYHIYNDKNKEYHINSVIQKSKIIKLFEICHDGNLRIWNFHSGSLLKKINIGYMDLRSLCLWNNNYIFIGCSNRNIKLVDFNLGLILKCFIGYSDIVVTIKKVIHPEFGECIISQNFKESKIKIWMNDNY